MEKRTELILSRAVAALCGVSFFGAVCVCLYLVEHVQLIKVETASATVLTIILLIAAFATAISLMWLYVRCLIWVRDLEELK